MIRRHIGIRTIIALGVLLVLGACGYGGPTEATPSDPPSTSPPATTPTRGFLERFAGQLLDGPRPVGAGALPAHDRTWVRQILADAGKALGWKLTPGDDPVYRGGDGTLVFDARRADLTNGYVYFVAVPGHGAVRFMPRAAQALSRVFDALSARGVRAARARALLTPVRLEGARPLGGDSEYLRYDTAASWVAITYNRNPSGNPPSTERVVVGAYPHDNWAFDLGPGDVDLAAPPTPTHSADPDDL